MNYIYLENNNPSLFVENPFKILLLDSYGEEILFDEGDAIDISYDQNQRLGLLSGRIRLGESDLDMILINASIKDYTISESKDVMNESLEESKKVRNKYSAINQRTINPHEFRYKIKSIEPNP